MNIFALEGTKSLAEALPIIVNSPQDLDARLKAQYGAWLCRNVSRIRRHVAPPQALPYSRRLVQSSTRRDPYYRTSSRNRIQCSEDPGYDEEARRRPAG